MISAASEQPKRCRRRRLLIVCGTESELIATLPCCYRCGLGKGREFYTNYFFGWPTVPDLATQVVKWWQFASFRTFVALVRLMYVQDQKLGRPIVM